MKNECDAEPDSDGNKVAAAWHGDDTPDREDGDRTERATTGDAGNVLRLGPRFGAADALGGTNTADCLSGGAGNEVFLPSCGRCTPSKEALWRLRARWGLALRPITFVMFGLNQAGSMVGVLPIVAKRRA